MNHKFHLSASRRLCRQSGNRELAFNLVKIFVTMGIIGVLATLVTSSALGLKNSAIAVKSMSSLRQLSAAFGTYANDNNVFPSVIGPSRSFQLYPNGPTFTSANTEGLKGTVFISPGVTSDLVRLYGYDPSNTLNWMCGYNREFPVVGDQSIFDRDATQPKLVERPSGTCLLIMACGSATGFGLNLAFFYGN